MLEAAWHFTHHRRIERIRLRQPEMRGEGNCTLGTILPLSSLTFILGALNPERKKKRKIPKTGMSICRLDDYKSIMIKAL